MKGLLKGPQVELSEEDASRIGLKNGDTVIVRGEGCEAPFTLKTSKGSRAGVAFVAENFEDAPVNRFFKKGMSLPTVSITKV